MNECKNLHLSDNCYIFGQLFITYILNGQFSNFSYKRDHMPFLEGKEKVKKRNLRTFFSPFVSLSSLFTIPKGKVFVHYVTSLYDTFL